MDKPWNNTKYSYVQINKSVPKSTSHRYRDKANLTWNPTLANLYYKNPKTEEEVKRGQGWLAVTEKFNTYLCDETKKVNLLSNDEFFQYVEKFNKNYIFNPKLNNLQSGALLDDIGQLKDGKIVWAISKLVYLTDWIDKTFDEDERIDHYLIFTNNHVYGKKPDIKMLPARADSYSGPVYNICPIDIDDFALDHKIEHIRNSHNRKIQTLSKVKYNNNDVIDYFNEVFPTTNKKKDKGDYSRNAELAYEGVADQPYPDSNFKGTWLAAFNSICWLIDTQLGHNADTRIISAWYGSYNETKMYALSKAIDYATKNS